MAEQEIEIETPKKKRKPFGFWLSTAWLAVVFFCVVAQGFLPLQKVGDFDVEYLGTKPMKGGHILGTDSNGFDVLSGLVRGARNSMAISVSSVVIGVTIGTLLGIVAAFRKGWLDSVISMYFNVTLAVPQVILALALVSIFATSTATDPGSPTRRLITVIMGLAFVMIPIIGRVARAAAASWSEREFVMAARSMGVKPTTIMFRHVLPNIIPAILAIAFLAAGVVIVVEGALSILGAGLIDGSSWGSMLAQQRNNLETEPWAVMFPVLVIALTVMAINYFGDYIRKLIDVREAKI